MIENYKTLLRVIVNQDNENTKSVVMVYDMIDNEKVVAIYGKSKYCAKFFNTKAKTIDSTISKKQLRNRRFKIERVKVDD